MSEPATVTVNGVAAQMSLNGLDFAATIPVTTGPNTLSITATETQASSPGLNLQSTTGSISVNIADETRRTLTYDANGSTATDSLGRTYKWDRANRLKAIAYSGPGNKRTEFSYDSSSRWNRIVERDSGVITSDKRFLWDGFKIAEERDASGQVTKRYFPEGLQDVAASQNSFYGLDHLGSVRSITNATGALQTHLQFDPWGRRNESPFNGPSSGFTGHYHCKHRDEVPGNNVSDGLELAPFRAYEGSLARWSKRDPIEEEGGLNLYAYVENEPVNLWDELGNSPNGCRGRAFIRAHVKDKKQCEKRLKEFDELWDESQSYGYLGPVALTGTLAASEAAAAAAAAAGTQARKLKVDGPKLNLHPKHGVSTGRVCQLRFGDTPIFRLDYTTTPRSPNKPVLHGHVWPFMNYHIH